MTALTGHIQQVFPYFDCPISPISAFYFHQGTATSIGKFLLNITQQIPANN